MRTLDLAVLQCEETRMYEIVQKKNSLSSLCPAAAAHTLVVVIIIYNNDDDRRHSRATSLENIPESSFSLSNSISYSYDLPKRIL